ncbi:hypothetical protein GW17_00050627, partial [Ensete ventricosum]
RKLSLVLAVFLSSSASDPVIWRGRFSSMPQAMARSPQSTSNKGSPNGPSLLSSPSSSSPLAQRSNDDPCDLLCEAADQVMRLRRLGRHRTVYDRGVVGPPRQPLPATYATSRNINDASTPDFTLQQLQAARVSLILLVPLSPGLRVCFVLMMLRWTGRGGPVRMAFGSVALRVAAASRATAAESATAATSVRDADRVPGRFPRAEGSHRHRRVPSPVRLQRARPEENHW